MTQLQQTDKERLLRIASYASVLTALVLITVKLIAWFLSDSVSILATLIDSSLDLLASLINLVAIYHALQPADKEHRFGHGKAEALAALGQSMFIMGSSGMLLLQALNRLFNPEQITEGLHFGLGVMVFSIMATLALVLLQKYVIRHTDSTAIKADALHYKTDLLINGGVILALILTYYGVKSADPLIGILIAGFILYSAWHIIKEAIDLLMDHEIPDEDRQRIIAIVKQETRAIGLHDLRTRRSGSKLFIQFHLELDGELYLREAHQIADKLEQEVAALFEDAEVIIHQDPVSVAR